jgi:hypothetical protein
VNVGATFTPFPFQAMFAVLLVFLSISALAATHASSEHAARSGRDKPMSGDVNPDQGLLGAWGGEHVSLELTAQGGSVEFDCAHGAIERAIVPDKSGRFDVPGRYVEEHGGPVRAGASSGGFAVRYSGQIKDGRMKLTVTRTGSKTRLGTFTLARGQEPSLVKCR